MEKIDWKKYALFNLSSFNPKLLSGILNISIWTMIQSFLAMATWFLFFIAVEHLGERPLAVSNIVRSAAMFFFMPVSTTSSLVSNLIGAQATSQVWSTCLKTIKMCYLFVIPIGIIILLAPATFLRIYTDDPQLIQATIPSLFVMMSAVFFPPPAVFFSTPCREQETHVWLYSWNSARSRYTFSISSTSCSISKRMSPSVGPRNTPIGASCSFSVSCI